MCFEHVHKICLDCASLTNGRTYRIKNKKKEIETEETNMPSLSEIRELMTMTDDDEDSEELDGSDMDVEPPSQDDICLTELPALASDIRLKIITCRGFINFDNEIFIWNWLERDFFMVINDLN